MGFFQKIRDRRLFQIVAGYAAAGWVVLEVLNQLIERGLLPELVFQVGFVWYLGGLMAALIVGWYHGEKGRQDIPVSEVSFLSLVGIGALLVTAVSVSRHLEAARAGGLAATQGSLDHRRIAVLYFDDATATDSLAYLADGLTEALIRNLSAIRSLDVLSENGALQFKGSGLSLDSVARQVGAGTVVNGVVRSSGDRILVDVALTDGESGTVFRRGTMERPTSQLLELESGLAEEVARLLRAWLGEEVALRADRGGTGSVGAWALLQRAERLRKEGESLFYDHGDAGGAFDAFSSADSLAAAAEAADPTWPRPTVLRSVLARRMGQLHLSEPLEADEFLLRGIEQASRVLAKDRRHAAALESRGILRYLRWSRSLEHDPVASAALLEDAEADLREAVRADPTRANAWNALSIIHAQNSDPVESKIAARRAYEEDAYLRSADAVLWGLYATSYDLEQFSDAVRYCREGARRFPHDPRFVECELWVLASPGLRPDPDRAWEVLERFVELTPEHRRGYARASGGMVVGGVLARAGLADSADAVLRRNRADASVDPSRQLLTFEAVFRLQMEQEQEAVRLIKTYLTARPEHLEGWHDSSHWWWRPLQANREFQELVGAETAH